MWRNSHLLLVMLQPTVHIVGDVEFLLAAEHDVRTVDSLLKPLLMREMLFGKLRKGGKAKAEAKNGKIVLT